MDQLPELTRLRASLNEAMHSLAEISAGIEAQLEALEERRSPPRTGLYLKGGKRLAVQESDYLNGWYVGHSPRNDSYCAEGEWADWVTLAHKIIEEDEKRRAAPKSSSM